MTSTNATMELKTRSGMSLRDALKLCRAAGCTVSDDGIDVTVRHPSHPAIGIGKSRMTEPDVQASLIAFMRRLERATKNGQQRVPPASARVLHQDTAPAKPRKERHKPAAAEGLPPVFAALLVGIKHRVIGCVHGVWKVEATLDITAADRWLKNQAPNRNVEQRWVDAMCRDQLAGNWQVTGDPIKFNAAGALTDGQHRCWSVVQSEVPIPVELALGVTEDAMAVVDSGRKRTFDHRLNMAGVEHHKQVAVVVRMLWGRDRGLEPTQRVQQPTELELDEAATRHADEVRDAMIRVPLRNTPVSAASLVYVMVLFRRLDSMAADIWLRDLIEGANLAKGDGVYALLQMLRKDNQRHTPSRRIKGRDLLACLIKSWNYRRLNKTVNTMIFRPSQESFPEPI